MKVKGLGARNGADAVLALHLRPLAWARQSRSQPFGVPGLRFRVLGFRVLGFRVKG